MMILTLLESQKSSSEERESKRHKKGISWFQYKNSSRLGRTLIGSKKFCNQKSSLLTLYF